MAQMVRPSTKVRRTTPKMASQTAGRRLKKPPVAAVEMREDSYPSSKGRPRSIRRGSRAVPDKEVVGYAGGNSCVQSRDRRGGGRRRRGGGRRRASGRGLWRSGRRSRPQPHGEVAADDIEEKVWGTAPARCPKMPWR